MLSTSAPALKTAVNVFSYSASAAGLTTAAKASGKPSSTPAPSTYRPPRCQLVMVLYTRSNTMFHWNSWKKGQSRHFVGTYVSMNAPQEATPALSQSALQGSAAVQLRPRSCLRRLPCRGRLSAAAQRMPRSISQELPFPAAAPCHPAFYPCRPSFPWPPCCCGSSRHHYCCLPPLQPSLAQYSASLSSTCPVLAHAHLHELD